MPIINNPMSKLYCTATSEKASKGQGGNEYIELSIKGEHQEELVGIRIIPSNFGYELKGWTNENKYFSYFLKEKGKSQKGECVCEKVLRVGGLSCPIHKITRKN